MSQLQELIRKLCPNGVEYKKLGKICDIRGRIGFRGYTRKDLVSESNGAITLSPSNIIDEKVDFQKCSYISWFKYEESPEIKVEIGDIIFTKTASVGKTALIRTLPKEATINPQLVLLKNIQCNAAYLSYILLDDKFQIKIKKLTGKGSVPNISQNALSNIDIPVPPLEVQNEIVRILDTFTSHTAELQAELQARKEQYEYYRNKLLSFDKNIKWATLNDICTKICSGGTPTTSIKEYYQGNIPWLRTQEINWTDIYDTEIKISENAVKESSAKLIPPNCVIVAMYGATAGKVCINKIPITTNQACCNLEINTNIASYKYVYGYVTNIVI